MRERKERDEAGKSSSTSAEASSANHGEDRSGLTDVVRRSSGSSERPAPSRGLQPSLVQATKPFLAQLRPSNAIPTPLRCTEASVEPPPIPTYFARLCTTDLPTSWYSSLPIQSCEARQRVSRPLSMRVKNREFTTHLMERPERRENRSSEPRRVRALRGRSGGI